MSSQATDAANSAEVHFASHGSYGVVDLGASKTVIGSSQVGDLMQSLPEEIRKGLSRTSCKMQFRFGNQGVLTSEHALVIPMGNFCVKIAVVPGNTPFLISNSFLRGIQATIDTSQHTLSSPHMVSKVPLQLSPRGLFLVDMNDIIKSLSKKTCDSVKATVCVADVAAKEKQSQPKGDGIRDNQNNQIGERVNQTSEPSHEETCSQGKDSSVNPEQTETTADLKAPSSTVLP